MKAKDIMTDNVAVVSPDATVPEIAGLLLERRISAAPVVSEAGKLVGIVSEGDLMRRQDIGTAARKSWWLDMIESRETRAADYVKAHGVTAADVMTPRVVSVDENAEIAEIAEILEKRRIKRVTVLRGGKLVGIVSRADLLRALVAQKAKINFTTDTSDKALRDAVRREINDAVGLGAQHVYVVVSDRVVHLWGATTSKEALRAVELAVQSVAGVGVVESHLSVIPVNLAMSGI